MKYASANFGTYILKALEIFKSHFFKIEQVIDGMRQGLSCSFANKTNTQSKYQAMQRLFFRIFNCQLKIIN